MLLRSCFVEREARSLRPCLPVKSLLGFSLTQVFMREDLVDRALLLIGDILRLGRLLSS